MNDFTAENIQQFLEQAAKANTRAWESQFAYFDGLVRRNTECLKDLGEARLASLKEISEASTFNQAFESNLAFEERLREELAELQEENVKAWEQLLENLKEIYLPADRPAKGKKAA